MRLLLTPSLIILPLALCAAAMLLPLAPLSGPDELARLILVELRLPRLLLGLGYGAVLGLTGAALQALFANPLASPDITGASSGAALGAVVGSTFLGLATPLAMGASGATGAALALLLLFAVAGRRPDAATLLLAGLAISLAAGAVTSLALALAPSPFAFYEAFDWLMGSLVDRSLGQAAAALVPAAIASALLARRSGALDRLALGEDVAASMGLAPERLRMEVVLLSAIAVGACVAVCGAVGFVGLIAPVLARRLTRGHPGRAMLPAALIGATILVAADLLTRLAPLGRTIPLGVITASLGTPIFLWVLLGMRGKLTS
ncbi:iron complex transport system permease protein [Sphingomonas kaistensis]|uniref:Iron complex transport system permease protein n=1 Tax=Sphingomonas kaistensis TaxID=298708 RepID=A0A7X5Y6X9_9SPHN|nr:iron ABC transporter permease [Sphingomonas kaistensis]NJC06282.1 iron complex transport system permease protein [Sphingomonas kaistensis]